MKKVFLIMCGFMLISATTAFSAGSWTDPANFTPSNISFKPSKNVSIYWDVDQNNNTYAIGSKHTKGNRVFATTSATNQIYYRESDNYVNSTGSGTGVSMPNAGQSTFGSGWSAI